MTVRSATKKKLMDFGLSDECAKQLATDRTISEVESMTPAQIAQVTNCSVEEGRRIRERIVSKDAHEIDRRLKFRSCTNQLHMSMRSVEADILCLADDRGRIDVNNLLRAHQDVSDDESEPLQEGVFVEMFRDDPVKADCHLFDFRESSGAPCGDRWFSSELRLRLSVDDHARRHK